MEKNYRVFKHYSKKIKKKKKNEKGAVLAVSLHTNRMANGKYPDQINIDNQLQY